MAILLTESWWSGVPFKYYIHDFLFLYGLVAPEWNPVLISAVSKMTLLLLLEKESLQ
jgi:hypothetical protein